MNKTKYILIQLNVVMLLLGYWLMHSTLSFVSGESSRTASIVFDGVQLALSIYIIAACHKDFAIEKCKSLLSVLSITLILYALRMVLDIYIGPFSDTLPKSQMWNDVLLTVGAYFFPIWAIISSRKHIDIQTVTKWIFAVGTITCIFVMMNISMQGISYEEGRVEAGQGLSTLSLAKLGSIEVIAAIHMLMNSKGRRIWVYALGLILGCFVALASGSRGGVVGFVVAFGVYLVMSARQKPFLMAVGITVVILFAINIVQILEWLGGYFPIFSNRMLATIVEGDTSEREDYFQKAIQYIGENPLTGFGYRVNADLTGYQPHNGILEIFLCFGIPLGIIFTYYIYIRSAIYSFVMMNDKRFVFVSLICIFSLASSMSGSSISSNVFDWSIALTGIAYYYHYNNERNRRKIDSY